MRIFATLGRRLTVADPGVSEPEPTVERSGLPHRFEAVGEALTSGSDVIGVCSVAGQELAITCRPCITLPLAWQSLHGVSGHCSTFCSQSKQNRADQMR